MMLVFAGAFPVQAQMAKPEVVTLKPFLSVDHVVPGTVFKVGVQAVLKPPWHVNSNTPSEDFLIPTTLTLDAMDGFNAGDPYYPEGQLKKFGFSDTPLSVYEEEVILWVPVSATAEIAPGEYVLSGSFSYQACDDKSCLAPDSRPFEVGVTVVPAGATVAAINEELFEVRAAMLPELAGDRSGDDLGALFASSGMFVTLVLIFLGGLALNLTPCVYPLIPITISFFVGQASGKIARSFLLALIYVLGMSITYSLLGVVAALTGELLGSSLQSPYVLIGIAVIFLVFAVGMFGAFEIRVPTALSNFAGGSRQGIYGSFFMGLTVGIVAAPCIGPFVVSLLTYVAAQGDPLTGFLLFFILSMGLGLPFLILGTFSGMVKVLPRSGEWMVWIKKVFGVVMVAVAVYFLATLIPEIWYTVLMTVVAIGGGVYAGFLEKSNTGFSWFKPVKILVGSGIICFGLWTAGSAWLEAGKPHIRWQPYDETLVENARESGKPVLIDFYADWCIPCKQIDKTLFSSQAVVDKSEQFLALKADLTNDRSDFVQDLRKKYSVLGVPTIIILGTDGQTFRRFTDELVDFEPAEFVDIMEEALED